MSKIKKLFSIQGCKDEESGAEVIILNSNGGEVGSCGEMTTNYGETFEDQTYRFTCDLEGKEVKIRHNNNEGVIRMIAFYITTQGDLKIHKQMILKYTNKFYFINQILRL